MHSGFTIWFTGLSGAGKTTVASLVAARLRAHGLKVEVLDGDVVRTNLSKGLGFSKEDRDTNIRRIGFVCELLSRNGVVAIGAAISPYRAIRDEIRARIPNFVEVYVECPLDVLIQRDSKGLYRKALSGEIGNSPACPTRTSRRYTPRLRSAPPRKLPKRAPQESGILWSFWDSLQTNDADRVHRDCPARCCSSSSRRADSRGGDVPRPPKRSAL